MIYRCKECEQSNKEKDKISHKMGCSVGEVHYGFICGAYHRYSNHFDYYKAMLADNLQLKEE